MELPPPPLLSQVAGPSGDLMFITQTGPENSREVQSQIRKHVMKDIGEARRKGGRRQAPLKFTLEIPESSESLSGLPITEPQRPMLPADQLAIFGENIPSAFGGLYHEGKLITQPPTDPSTAIAHPSIERLWTGRLDPFFEYPIKMDRYSFQLIDHVFDDRYGNMPPYRDAWFPVAVTDAATFHQLLSNTALNLAALRARDRPPEIRESLIHHTKSVALVKQSMSEKSTATSDAVIASITAFACYAHVTGSKTRWLMHMNALKEIIRLRGGIDNLNSNWLLRMVIFWVDTETACTEDVPPTFPMPTKSVFERLGPGQFIPRAPLAKELSNPWNDTFPQHSEIMNIVDDIRSFTVYLKGEVLRTRGTVYRRGELAQCNMLPLQHRLLGLLSTSDSDAQQKVDILRLGCMLYMAEIRRLWGVMGVLSFIQTEKLRQLLEVQTRGWEPFSLLKAWVLAMGAMESRGGDRDWFFTELEKSKAELRVGSWVCLGDKFRQILWYEDVHDQMFLELCNGIELANEGSHMLGGSRFGGYRPVQ